MLLEMPELHTCMRTYPWSIVESNPHKLLARLAQHIYLTHCDGMHTCTRLDFIFALKDATYMQMPMVILYRIHYTGGTSPYL